MSEQAGRGGDVSRRGFLKGVGGVLGAAALVSPTVQKLAAQTTEAPARAGLKKFAAAGSQISLNVNGAAREVTVTPATTLLDALREKLDLTGSKEVCGHGACGACTVLIDGKPVNSCLTLAVDAVGHEVTTVEGLARGETLDPVQAAFAEHDACQCGYCIPGFVVSARALLNQIPNPSLDQIKDGLSGNICRCAAYKAIFEAVAAAGGTKLTGGAV